MGLGFRIRGLCLVGSGTCTVPLEFVSGQHKVTGRLCSCVCVWGDGSGSRDTMWLRRGILGVWHWANMMLCRDVRSVCCPYGREQEVFCLATLPTRYLSSVGCHRNTCSSTILESFGFGFLVALHDAQGPIILLCLGRCHCQSSSEVQARRVRARV